MNDEYVKALEQSLQGVLGAMAGLDVIQIAPDPKLGHDVLYHDSITGVISLNSATVHFSVALIFPTSVITAMAQRMLPGIEIQTNHAMVVDLVGEMANMVVGGAKNSLDESGSELNLSLPVVVAGHDYHVEHKSEGQLRLSQFQSELGEIHIESSYQSKRG